ncbi:MAG TPA: choice-of-anchor Q domain-containing protein [Rhizomicrobium sp.]|nr:choice-of-anchor Q domain-containing protein [Rhizomicrobium sp.]
MANILDTVTGATAAWSTGRQLRAAFTSSPADFSSGVCTIIRDQVGTRNASPAGSPAQGSGTINANAYVKLDGTNDKFTFSALALGTGDWTLLLAVGFTGTAAGPLVGHTTTTTGIVHSSTTGFSIRSDSAGPLSYSTGWAIPKGFHVLRFARTGSGATIQIFQNGEAISTAKAISGAFTLDEFGAQQVNDAWSNAGFGECIVFPRLLTSTEITAIEADMTAAWHSAIYVDDTGGNDANVGWAPQLAVQTIGAVRPLHLRRGSRVLLKAGGVWRRDPLLFNQSFQTGDVSAPFVIDQYGTGAQPKLIGSTQVPGPYTLVTGTEYKKTVTLTNVQGVWAYDGTGAITRLVAGTAGSLTTGQYAYASGELHFNVGVNPSSYTLECAQQDGALADIDGCRPARPYMNVSNLHLIHWPEDGLLFDADNCQARNILAEWNASDGIGGAALNLYLGQSTSQHNGKGRVLSGSPGDGVSLHGGSTVVIEDVKSLYNDKAGIDHQETVTATMRNCWIEGSNQNIWGAVNTGPVATQTWENCVVVRRPGDYVHACQFVRSTTHVVRHLTIVNMDVASNYRGINVNSTGNVTIQNCITDGFATGLGLQAAGTLTHDHNLHHDTAAYNGTSAGTGDLTGDPLFTNRAAADYSLQSGSPAIDAGVNLGVTIDYLHNPRPVGAAPDMGAFERQSGGPPPPSLILDTVTGAVAAWSTGRQLTSTFTLAPADVSAGVYSLIRDQVGSRNATAAGSPAAGSGGTLAFAQLDGVNDKFGFSSLSLGTGDWTACMAVKFQASAAGPLIGRTATTTGIRESSTTNFDLRSDSAGPQPYNMAAIAAGFHVLRIARNGTAGNITIYLDGTAIGNGMPRTIAGSFTFDQFGVQRTSDAWSNMGFGECIIFPRLLSSSDATAVEQDMLGAWV